MYKLKITGSKKPKILMWELSPDYEGIDFYIKETLKKIRTNNKMKISTCSLLKNDGTFLKSFNHLVTEL